MEIRQWVHYLGGHVDYPNRSSGVLTVTPAEVDFKASEYVANQYHFRFPTEKLRSARLQTLKEISAGRTFLLGPILAAAMKKEVTYVVVEYEGESGLSQTLLFDIPDDIESNEKTELVNVFEEAFAEAKRQKT